MVAILGQHVVAQLHGSGMDMVCLNCGDRKQIEVPAPMSVMVRRLNGFEDLHMDCRGD